MLRKPSLPDAETLRKRIPARVLEIARAVADEGGACYLVGGWVRDAMLGIPSKDVDVEVHRLPEERLERLLRRFGRPSSVGRSFGILLMKVDGEEVDFALPRVERKTGGTHRDFAVRTDPEMGFAAAAARRDFTINAMGLKLPELELCDPYGGEKDLGAGLLRHVGPAFGEDPLRALRGAQFAARFGLEIVPETLEICSEQDLSALSVERIDEEFRKLLLKPERPSVGLEALKKMELLRFFPELDLPDGPWARTLRAADAAARLRGGLPGESRLPLMLAALCSELELPAADALLERLTRDLRVAKAALARVARIPSLRAFAADPGSDAFGRPWARRLALDLPLADALALLGALGAASGDAVPDAAPRLRALAGEAGVLEAPPKPWLQGRDLSALGMKPGPKMGEVLREAFEKQLDEEFSSPEEALAWVKKTAF